MEDEDKVQSQPMAPIAISAIQTGEPFPLAYDSEGKAFLLPEELKELPDVKPSATVHIRMLIGNDQSMLLKAQAKEPAAIEEIAVCHRVMKVTNGEGELTTPKAIRRFYQMTDWAFQKALKQKIEEVEGGVDSEISMYCRHCDGEQIFVVPLGPKFFGLN
jgi:hypothetical protein